MIIPIGFIFLQTNHARLILLGVCLVVILLDFLRLHVNGVKEAFILFFGSFLRRHELTQLNGATYFLIGCTITSFLFRSDIIIASIIFISVGDTLATIVGKNVKSPVIFKNKTILGSVSFFVGASIAGLIFYMFIHFLPIYVIVFGALIATVLEALPLPFDDNFYVPILTGLILTFIRI